MAKGRNLDVHEAITEAIMNVSLEELSNRVGQLGGMTPYDRDQVEKVALQLVMTHVALKVMEAGSEATVGSAASIAAQFTRLWNHRREQVLKLIPVKEDGGEKLH